MSRAFIVWFVVSVVAIILGFVVTTAAPSAGTVLVVAGVLSLTATLLYAWRVATTHDDQWVWQTPGKPRRQYLEEQAAKQASNTSRSDPDDKA